MFAAPGLGESESRAIFVDPYTNAVRGDLTVYGTSGASPVRTWVDPAAPRATPRRARAALQRARRLVAVGRRPRRSRPVAAPAAAHPAAARDAPAPTRTRWLPAHPRPARRGRRVGARRGARALRDGHHVVTARRRAGHRPPCAAGLVGTGPRHRAVGRDGRRRCAPRGPPRRRRVRRGPARRTGELRRGPRGGPAGGHRRRPGRGLRPGGGGQRVGGPRDPGRLPHRGRHRRRRRRHPRGDRPGDLRRAPLRRQARSLGHRPAHRRPLRPRQPGGALRPRMRHRGERRVGLRDVVATGDHPAGSADAPRRAARSPGPRGGGSRASRRWPSSSAWPCRSWGSRCSSSCSSTPCGACSPGDERSARPQAECLPPSHGWAR